MFLKPADLEVDVTIRTTETKTVVFKTRVPYTNPLTVDVTPELPIGDYTIEFSPVTMPDQHLTIREP